MTTLSHPAAAAHRRRPANAPVPAWHRWLAAWRCRRRHARTQSALLALDPRTLRDIGLARAEIGSVSAELHGLAARTRARLS